VTLIWIQSREGPAGAVLDWRLLQLSLAQVSSELSGLLAEGITDDVEDLVEEPLVLT
jgi:hypothetical protein